MRPERKAKSKRKGNDALSSSSPAKKKTRKTKRQVITIKQSTSSSSSSESDSDEESGDNDSVHRKTGEEDPAPSISPSHEGDSEKSSGSAGAEPTGAQPPAHHSTPVSEANAVVVPQHSSVVQPASASSSASALPSASAALLPERQPPMYTLLNTTALNDPQSLFYKVPFTEADYASLGNVLTQTVLDCVNKCHVHDARAVEHITKHVLDIHIWQINTARLEGLIAPGMLDKQHTDNILRVVTQNVVGLAVHDSECSTFVSLSNDVRVYGKAVTMIESSFLPDKNGVYDLGKITKEIVSTLQSNAFVDRLCEVAFREQRKFPVCAQLTRRIFDDWRKKGKAPLPIRKMIKTIVQKVTSTYIYTMVDNVMS